MLVPVADITVVMEEETTICWLHKHFSFNIRRLVWELNTKGSIPSFSTSIVNFMTGWAWLRVLEEVTIINSDLDKSGDSLPSRSDFSNLISVH